MVRIFNYTNLDMVKVDYRNKNVVIYGRGMEALYAYMELKGQQVNLIGFVDSFSRNGETFAGCRVFELSSLVNMEKLIVYVAVRDEAVKREILYLLDDMELNDATIVSKGVVYGAWKYDRSTMEHLIEYAGDKIKYVSENLYDEHSADIFHKLVDYRRTNDRKLIEACYETTHKQYFPGTDILKNGEEEVFIDAGGFDGLTTVDFAQWTDNRYKKSIVLEADDEMFNICSEMMRIKKLDRVEVIKKAVYSYSTILAFDDSDYLSGSGTINGAGKKRVESISIDELAEREKITYIKMDIEGAEMDALKGAEKTIERDRPKLAISIYHKDDDLWEIPYYLMKKYSFYRYYIRHYTPYTTETVLYATV